MYLEFAKFAIKASRPKPVTFNRTDFGWDARRFKGNAKFASTARGVEGRFVALAKLWMIRVTAHLVFDADGVKRCQKA